MSRPAGLAGLGLVRAQRLVVRVRPCCRVVSHVARRRGTWDLGSHQRRVLRGSRTWALGYKLGYKLWSSNPDERREKQLRQWTTSPARARLDTEMEEPEPCKSGHSRVQLQAQART